MDNNAKIVLNLIQKVVDGDSVIEHQLMARTNWREVMALCLSQGVSGICFDALEKLEELSRPPKKLLMEWFGQVIRHENLYKQHKVTLGHLAQFYEQEDIRMILLKGYGLSLFWPKPERRPVGDIDCYNFGQHELADRRMSEKYGIEIDNTHHKHSVFQFENTTVENHYSFLNVHGHRSTSEIERILEEEVKKDLNVNLKNVSGGFRFHVCEDREIRNLYYPSVRFNSLYLLRHSAEHFTSVDINLRQVLDWGFFVRANDVDWEWLICQLDRVGMKQYLAVLNAICIRYLGFDASLFPALEADESLVERSLNDMLSPEFQMETHKNAFAEIVYRLRRWNANRWKHDMVYRESAWQSLCTQIWSHVLKPSL